MNDWNDLLALSVGYRQALSGLLEPEESRATAIPPTWKNNLHWHAGHLVVTPQLLTYGLAGESLRVPPEYRTWFGKGSSPADWGDAPVPPFSQLVHELEEITPRIFHDFEGRGDLPYARPYMTSVGVELRTPAQALAFSVGHDGIHLGMILALRRGLDAMGDAAAAGHR